MQNSSQSFSSFSSEIIVFFDGFCVLCNSSVDFLLKIDQNKKLKFASLQGKIAKKILPKETVEELNTIVLFFNGRLYYKSNAALQIIQIVGGGWKVFLVFKIFPRVLRDLIYDTIAKYRYQWFGKRESCRMLSKEDLGRLLD